MPRAIRLANGLRRTAMWSERILAVTIFAGMGAFFIYSVLSMSHIDWSHSDTLYELINRVLLLVICLELVRTLLTHELEAVLELLAFVVARKTLKPDLTATEILFSVIAFVILMAARKYFILSESERENSALEAPESEN